MFRRGRAPLLGAAVVVGASRSAARREVARQGQASQQAQYAADAAAESKRREEEENARRTQLAIDEAIAKERSRRELAEAEARNIESRAEDNKVNSNEGKKAGVRYCGECGNQCKVGDKFCNSCGAKQPTMENVM